MRHLAPRTAGGRVSETLADPRRYLPAIRRVAGALATRQPAAAVLLDRDQEALARRLAAEVGPDWQARPAPRRVIFVDKPRSVVVLEPLDRVVHTVVASALMEAFEQRFAEGLFSYRRGRGSPGAADRLHACAVAHQATRPDPRTRGLWVLRFDVANYGDSVPIHDGAELWDMLAAWLPDEPPWLHRLVRSLSQCGAHGSFATCGVPNGSALSNPLINLYLADVDTLLEQRALTAVRYGDDVGAVFATADEAEAALSEVLAVLARKGLGLRQEKLARLYWTGSGRRPEIGGWSPARHVTMCGLDVAFNGGDRVKTARRRALLADLFTRLRNSSRLLPVEVPEVRAKLLCEAASVVLDPRSPLALPGFAPFLRNTSCRVQLREMDRMIAIEVAGLAANARGPRAFRQVAWRRLYDLGLPSLTVLRNR